MKTRIDGLKYQALRLGVAVLPVAVILAEVAGRRHP
jgi:hypothetical protein